MAGGTNLAGRAGSWSAAHWKTATFGWIAFAVTCVVLGSAVGAIKLTDAEYASGQAARAESMLQQAGFDTPATESVLIQSKTMIYEQLLPTVAVAHVVEMLSAQPDVTNIVSPIGNPNAGIDLEGSSLGARAVRRQGRRRRRQDEDRAGPEGDRARPEGEPARDDRGVRPRERRPLDGRGVQAGHDARRVHLAAVDARDPARRVRRARRGGTAGDARVLRSARRDGAQRARQSRHPHGRRDDVRDPHGRHGRRRRLLALLPPARAGRAAQRQVAARVAAAHRGNVRDRRCSSPARRS